MFETCCIFKIRNDITDIKYSQTKIFQEISTRKHKINLNDKAISVLQIAKDSLQDKYEKINDDIFDAKQEIDDLKNKFELKEHSTYKTAVKVN